MLHKFSITVRVKPKLFRLAISAACALSLGCLSAPIFGQQPGQRTFTSAEDAGSEFFAAMESQDEQAPLRILGPGGKDVLSSGDAIEDSDARVGFVTKYQEMHRFVTEPNGKVTLVIGAENWPFPIPLVNNHGSWYFDTSEGKDEIVFRRIGKNELAAMSACRDLVDAQKQYFARPPANLPKQFAQKLVSDEGGTMVCTGRVPTTSLIARSTLSSLTRAKISQRTRLASMFRSTGICSVSSLAKDDMHRAERRST